jgi:hypothetical protein
LDGGFFIHFTLMAVLASAIKQDYKHGLPLASERRGSH